MNYQNTKNEQLRGLKARGKRVPSGKTYMSSLLEKRNRGAVILFFLCAASILVKIHIAYVKKGGKSRCIFIQRDKKFSPSR